MSGPTGRVADRTARVGRELTLSFQRGDEGAFDAIYEHYAPVVLKVCERMLRHPQDAQDALQETFLRVYQALGSFNGRYELRAWITRIATNVCLDHLRWKKRKAPESVSFEQVSATVPVDEIEGPEASIGRWSDEKSLRELLGALPPLQRAAVLLRDIEGVSYTDIAATLETSEGRARVLVHRARKLCRKNLSFGAALTWQARMAQRMFRFRSGKTSEIAHAASAAGEAGAVVARSAPLMSTCAGVFQQCGMLVGERLVPLAVGALVGLTATGVGAPFVSSDVPPLPEARFDQVETERTEHGRSGVVRSVVGGEADPTGDGFDVPFEVASWLEGAGSPAGPEYSIEGPPPGTSGDVYEPIYSSPPNDEEEASPSEAQPTHQTSSDSPPPSEPTPAPSPSTGAPGYAAAPDQQPPSSDEPVEHDEPEEEAPAVCPTGDAADGSDDTSDGYETDPTPEPSSEPTPAEEPSSAPEEQPSGEPEPTPSEQPSSGSEPTPSEEPSSAPEEQPSGEPQPTPEEQPSAEPEPAPQEEPSPEPEPTPYQEPADEPASTSQGCADGSDSSPDGQSDPAYLGPEGQAPDPAGTETSDGTVQRDEQAEPESSYADPWAEPTSMPAEEEPIGPTGWETTTPAA